MADEAHHVRHDHRNAAKINGCTVAIIVEDGSDPGNIRLFPIHELRAVLLELGTQPFQFTLLLLRQLPSQFALA